MAKVSIIMPVYNAEQYIGEAIESVLAQSYKNWELLVVDDGSTDHSAAIMDAYSLKDDRIKVFHKCNEGVSAARNFAMNRASGAFITFLDSDDAYHPDRLQRIVRVFAENPDCDIVFSRHLEFTGERTDNHTNRSGMLDVVRDDLLRSVISNTENHFVWNSTIRAYIAKKGKFAAIRFAEDYCYIRDCAWYCRKMAILDDVLYYYRRDNENAMTSHFFSERYVPDYMELVKNTYQFCVSHKVENNYYRNMVAHEYAQNSMRIRKCTSYAKFVDCMNDQKFREGIIFADPSQCTPFERLLFFMVKHKLYLPFAFWIW